MDILFNILVLAGMFVGFVLCYWAWAWVIAVTCKVPFEAVWKFWK